MSLTFWKQIWYYVIVTYVSVCVYVNILTTYVEKLCYCKILLNQSSQDQKRVSNYATSNYQILSMHIYLLLGWLKFWC